MKKILLVSILLLSFISCTSASELSFQIIKDDISKQANSSFLQNTNENTLRDSESLIFNEIKITICKRDFFNKENDCDDWYNSNDMYNLYKNIIHKEKISYGFGSDIQVAKIKTNYVLDYVVLSMYDNEDIRFERYIIIFDNKKSIIFKLEYPDTLDSVKKEMKMNHFLNYVDEEKNEYYFWSDNVNKSQIVRQLRNQEFNCESLQNIFDKTEFIKDIIKASIANEINDFKLSH